MLTTDAIRLGQLEAARRKSRRAPMLSSYGDDPNGYAKDILKAWWWDKLAEIAESVKTHKRTAVRAAHGVGKSFTAAGLVNWWFDSKTHSIVLSTAPTHRQVQAVLWREIRTQRKTTPLPDINQIRDPADPAHYAVGYTSGKDLRMDAFESQSAQGIHAENLLVVIDEAGGVRPSVWNAIDGMAVGETNRVLAIGNPTVPSGPFFDAAHSPKWHTISIPVFDHPNIEAGLKDEPEPIPGAVSFAWLMEKLSDPSWVERVDEEVTGPSVFLFDGARYRARPIAESLLLAQFPSTVTDTVWALAWLEAARGQELTYRGDAPLEVGVDVARFGMDSTAAHVRRGPVSLAHQAWSKEDNTSVAGRVYRLVIDTLDQVGEAPEVIIRIDTTGGHGAGPADILRERFAAIGNIRVIDVNSSETANDQEHYPNMRSELWFSAADRGREGNLDLSRLPDYVYMALVAQLTAPKFKYDSQGRKVVEPKEDTRLWLQRSPDDADAFNLAYAGTGKTAAGIPQMQQPSTWRPQAEDRPRWGLEGDGGRGWRSSF